MKKIMFENGFLAYGIILLFLVSGCAPIISGAMNATVTDDKVVTKTADYFGVSQDQIDVTRIKKGTLATSYKTRYAGKLYNCSIYYGEVTCKIPGS